MCLPRTTLSGFSEEEKIAFFKVFPCGREYNHDFAACFYSHPGEKAKRRCLLEHMYGGKLCPDTKQNGECPRGDACHMTHSMFEYYMHPLRYRTKLCKDGTSCNRPFCFFAHQPSELRQPIEASTFLASLNPQAVAATAERLINNSSSSTGGSVPRFAGSGIATEAVGSPMQVMYAGLQPANLQQPQQVFVPAASAVSAGVMSPSHPRLQMSPSGMRASYGGSSASARLLSSPSSAISSSSSNVDPVFLLQAGSMAASAAGSDLPSPVVTTIYQPTVTAAPAAMAAGPEVLLCPPRPMLPAVTGELVMLSGGNPMLPQQQWQQQMAVQDPAMLSNMIGQLSLADTAVTAVPTTAQMLNTVSMAGSAAAAGPSGGGRLSLDDAVRHKQQQQMLTNAVMMNSDVNRMLQQQDQLQQQLLAAGLATTAAEVACMPHLVTGMQQAVAGASMPASTTALVGSGGVGLGNVRYESLFEAPLFSGVQW